MTRPGFGLSRIIVAALAAAAAQGCSTAPKDPVPISSATGLPTGPVDTGTYPDLNVAPGAANKQFTAGEEASKKKTLTERRKQVQSAPSTSAGEAAKARAELEARRKRSEDVLKQIEGAAAAD